jgi:predicted aspartyl protease
MKKIPCLIFILFLVSCSGLSKIFNKGTLTNIDYKEIIPFNYDYNYAIVEVEINSIKYNFLVDTGAPTVISNAIYEDLKIEAIDYIAIEDSQGQINSQKVVVVPEIKIGNLTYHNTGGVVADLRNVFEFDCMGIDGIIGSNQMAKSYWKFDYQNREITITDQLAHYDLTTYTDTLSFIVSASKTPYLRGHVNGLETLFVYDTGFGGHIDIDRELAEFKEADGFTNYGNSGIGLYGVIDSTTIRTIKTDSLRIGSIEMGAQVVDLDFGNLIGNKFMNKHDVVMDWTSQKIYLKKLKEFEKTQQNSFGFKFRIKENKALVTGLIEEFAIDLQLGDVLLSINDFEFKNITDSNACEKWNAINYKDVENLKIVYLRDGIELTTTLKIRELIK